MIFSPNICQLNENQLIVIVGCVGYRYANCPSIFQLWVPSAGGNFPCFFSLLFWLILSFSLFSPIERWEEPFSVVSYSINSNICSMNNKEIFLSACYPNEPSQSLWSTYLFPTEPHFSLVHKAHSQVKYTGRLQTIKGQNTILIWRSQTQIPYYI